MENLIKKLIKTINEEEVNSIKWTIASFFIDNLDFVAQSQTKEIAKQCHVSPASIIRFCSLLGYSGINELKYIVKNSKANYPARENWDENERNYLEIWTEGFLNLSTNLKNNKQIFQCFEGDRSIYIFAFNVAYFASKNFLQRIRVKNYKVFLEQDISTIDWYIDHIKNDDVIIFVSLSGNNYILQNFAKKAKGKCQTFAVIGDRLGFENDVDNHLLLENKESNFWNLYSIRSQLLQQLWDLLLIQL
ncbi:Transcriptional regulator, RpiR family [Spiroplasma clarkii]|uniref:MurR/RpiR family transcriptional regulator n=1 Tax=Spiroplasma clarkii TaxID=2139 RepID=A0A1Y0L0J0_9MOLU|nr:MurR/RpiR family transcriptional regulator [Spiroplasma clarkii]ARU91493.1 Transcriptional regulator, RpiR family [Spiroplasma clarkii]ATX70909.1 MurR/RpiR family transcriptional regulator [Spiroplasma clarkii]